MSKPLDSNLYGGALEARLLFFKTVSPLLDIYGDENEYAVPLQEHEDGRDEKHTITEKGTTGVQSTSTSKVDYHSPRSSPTGVKNEALRSLPAKPLSPNSAALSYSAQIAQQFSAYQQTPSQERQQRTEIPLPPHPRTTSTSGSSGTVVQEGSANAGTSDSIFGKKPSEMHDAG
jgi:RNA-binding protein Musashi